MHTIVDLLSSLSSRLSSTTSAESLLACSVMNNVMQFVDRTIELLKAFYLGSKHNVMISD